MEESLALAWKNRKQTLELENNKIKQIQLNNVSKRKLDIIMDVCDRAISKVDILLEIIQVMKPNDPLFIKKNDFETNLNMNIVFTDDNVSVSYAEDYRLAICGITKVDTNLWFVNRVNVPEGMGRGRGIGSQLLKKALETIEENFKQQTIYAMPGGYAGDIGKQINFYVKNEFVKHSDEDYYIYKTK